MEIYPGLCLSTWPDCSSILTRMWLLLLVLIVPFNVEAYGKKTEQQSAFSDLQASYNKLQHQLSNNKSEIKAFEERLLNFEVMLDAIREEALASKEQQKESIQTRSHSLELRITNLEQASKALASDIKQLSNHSNDTKHKLSEIENALAQQNKNFANLQNAVTSLIEAFQDKPDSSTSTRYTVKNGDSLDKIAKTHQTSVQALKEFNGMTSDKIIVGKTIKIPPK